MEVWTGDKSILIVSVSTISVQLAPMQSVWSEKETALEVGVILTTRADHTFEIIAKAATHQGDC